MWWPSTDSTSSRMARKLPCASPRAAAVPLASSLNPARARNPVRRQQVRETPREAKREARRSESVSSVHLTAGSDVAIDGGHLARWLRRLSPVARIGVAGGRLPHHSGGYVLPRRQSGCDGL